MWCALAARHFANWWIMNIMKKANNAILELRNNANRHVKQLYNIMDARGKEKLALVCMCMCMRYHTMRRPHIFSLPICMHCYIKSSNFLITDVRSLTNECQTAYTQTKLLHFVFIQCECVRFFITTDWIHLLRILTAFTMLWLNVTQISRNNFDLINLTRTINWM